MYYQGGSAIQASDDLQTLYLMNPNNAQQPHANIVFLNSATASTTVRAPLPQAQQFVGIPLSQDAHRPLSFPGQQDEVHAHHEYEAITPSFDYNNLWRSVDHDHPNTSLPTPKCLSLSLSSDQTGLNKSFLNDQDFLVQSSIGMVLPRISSKRGKIMGSKYLKAAQLILDEVANVGEGIHTNLSSAGSKEKAKIIKASISSGKHIGGAEPEKPTAAQRQEIQMKKAKLVAMLDEVEQRYRSYQHQMHMIVALFEQTAGIGSSKRYTQVASRTISKQFRCLKDAISSQIMASNNSLREDGNEEEIIFEGPRVEISVNCFRQQSAWRGQRGLPERAVSVLRAWLFENFLHPYPKGSDKNMMAKQTGLTRSQVSNWFINARVRLWKPMVEEMYLEEMKNQQQIYNSKLETTAKSIRTNKELGRQKVRAPNQQENSSTTPKVDAFQSKKHDLITNQVFHPSPTEISSSTVGASFAELIRSINMENNNPAQIDPKKPRKENAVTDQDNSPKCNQISEISKGFSSSHAYFSRHGRFSTEQKSTGFHGNSVSLTLALPPSASSHWSPGLSQHQQNLPSNSTLEFGTRIPETGIVESGSRVDRVQDSSIGYEILDFQNRNPFPATHLPDFMA